MNILVVDTNSDAVACIDEDDFEKVVTPWFPEAPEEVYQAIGEMQKALLGGPGYRITELAQYLDLAVEYGSVTAKLVGINEPFGSKIVDTIKVESPSGNLTWKVTLEPSEDSEPYDQALRDAGFHHFIWEESGF